MKKRATLHEVLSALLTVSVLGALVSALPVGAAIPKPEREALLALYEATGGPSWDSSANWGGPAGSENTWYGVTTDGANTKVLALDLAGNGLSGSLPPAMADLTSLESLDLSMNGLTGPVPAALRGLDHLTMLDLSGNPLEGIPAGVDKTVSNVQVAEVSAGLAPDAAPIITGLEFKLQMHNGVVLVCKFTLTGKDFQDGCVVQIDGQPVPKSLFESSTKVLAKGGAKLKKMVPKRQTVNLTVANPDGQVSLPYPYTR